MPLTGELEHLPIVDVIQLIHSTRKSGTLNVYSRKGEAQLSFDNGYIVGASHSSEKLRIGQILCEYQIISSTDLEKALKSQNAAGADRKPLITTLLDHCGLSKDSAYKALETLIELTVVEMISWTKGIFTLDVNKLNAPDDYRYLPIQLQDVNLNTQMVLMDALRIFDEKVHSGEIVLSEDSLEEEPFQPAEIEDKLTESEPDNEIIVSADILGLGDLDKVERKKPRVFKSLEAFDPSEIHRQVINNILPDLSSSEQAQLADFLAEVSKPHHNISTIPTASQAIIMYSSDEFIQHAIMTVCKKEGILVFVTKNS